ncbi:FAD-dependent oxidoreductase [Streptomyces cinnabarinus]|uniref:FAD-dependent oxidoreductase n=1 Tax=Streptomyces cinnabarinus TaxID=67287 RepID=A0ABY7KRS4_9ACTN|nr:FAD-dependent monooxygenase [Streptomyces cinnabarinus]WAZ26708.1 FAD-dependent oxidoreductase [Streptomyces cinnabarinus]
MPHTLVLGAGPVGLVTAMLLAADGHRVTVLDRDPADSRTTAAVFGGEWKRPGVAQFGHTHIFMPAGYQTLARELPGAAARLLAVGGRPHNMIEGAFGAGEVGERQEGDERFETVAARRPVLEMALFAEARETPGITVRCDVKVTGLVTGDARTLGTPHVVGVTTRNGETITADLVVDATGRSTRIPALLADLGAAPTSQHAAVGFRYYTRYFRSEHGDLPAQPTWPIFHYNSISAITAPGDHDTWSLTLVTSGRDQQLRALKDPNVWTRVAASYPDVSHWLAGEPITDVNAMGGTESKHWTYTVDGTPVVTGLVAVGDSWATTNPQFGMGMTVGVRHALLLRESLRKFGADNPIELALHFDRDTKELLEPIWSGSLNWDEHRLAEIDAEIRGERYTTDDDDWNLRSMLDAVRLRDPHVLRSYAEVGCMLAGPAEVLARPGLVERIIELGANAPRYPYPGPDRTQLLEIIEAN